MTAATSAILFRSESKGSGFHINERLKTRSDQILAKLINQGKIFLSLKIAEIDMRGQFWVEKNDSRQKTHFTLKLNSFSGGK